MLWTGGSRVIAQGGQDGFVPCPPWLLASLQRRCNPFFVRCLKPNNKKVRASLGLSYSWQCRCCLPSLARGARRERGGQGSAHTATEASPHLTPRSRGSLRLTWLAASCGIQGSWRLSASARRASPSASPSSSSSTGALGAVGWVPPSQRGEATKLVGVFGGSVWPGGPPQWELGAPTVVHSTGRSFFPRHSANHHGEGLCQCPSGVPHGDGVVVSPRYRCLVDMWSNVIPNGSNCVEMLRNLCPVSPSMYYVGVSKVPSQAEGSAPGMPWGRVAKGGGLTASPPAPSSS